jgi:hypothetical protein
MSVLSVERPQGLLPLRVWLVAWRESLVKNPAPTTQYAQDILAIDYELAELDEKLRRAAFMLISKLPVCEECDRVAFYMLRHGPFLCEEHAQEHPTAQKVPWHDDAKVLGLGQIA